jgi:LPS sulfotransferase NodH
MTLDPSQRGYVICTAARSGSNFLAQLLTSSGELGRPLEYFNGPARRALDHPDYPDDPEAQLLAIPKLGATANGVYGFKLFMTQFEDVAHTRWALRLPNLSFLHLERRDVLGQAISFARAIQTGQYRSTSPRNGQAIYDGLSIARCLSTVITHQARWRAYFAINGLNPQILVYEDVVADPNAAVATVGRLMNLPSTPRADQALVDLQVQRDAESDEWRARFLAEHGDVTVPLALDLHNLPCPAELLRALAG